jgi:hypothetical protein
MTYYRIITEDRLNTWVSSNPVDATQCIVELVDRLCKASLENPEKILISKDTEESGADGSIICDSGYKDYIPSGISFWEIGINSDAMRKIREDYEKFESPNKDRILGNDPQDVSLVFVVPRKASGKYSREKQNKWIHEKKSTGNWKGIYIIDTANFAIGSVNIPPCQSGWPKK